jgi:hypothetical protein
MWRAVFPPTPTAALPVQSTPRHSDHTLLMEVRKVNAAASMLILSPLAGFSTDEPVECLLAKRMAATISEKPADRAILAVLLGDHERTCEFVKFAKPILWAQWREVVSLGRLPQQPFVFDVYWSEEWSTMGLFAEQDTCERVKQEAETKGLGIRACRLWSPDF